MKHGQGRPRETSAQNNQVNLGSTVTENTMGGGARIIRSCFGVWILALYGHKSESTVLSWAAPHVGVFWFVLWSIVAAHSLPQTPEDPFVPCTGRWLIGCICQVW